MAVSLTKVADIDRSLQNEDAAKDGFKEVMKLLDSLKLTLKISILEQRVRSFAPLLSFASQKLLNSSAKFSDK